MSGLVVENLSYAYGPKQALDAVSFNATEGGFHALLGANGAGKSTLFALLTRLIAAPEGRIEIAGHDLAKSAPTALRALGIVFQQPTLDLDLTVRQNIRYFLALQGHSGQDATDRVEASLATLSMADRADEKVRALNGGHRRRAEIARALSHSPKVLLLDEPTVGLDAASRAAITAEVHALARDQGVTVLWATHLTDEIDDADHLFVLHHGRILADTNVAAFRGDHPLGQAFLQATGADMP